MVTSRVQAMGPSRRCGDRVIPFTGMRTNHPLQLALEGQSVPDRDVWLGSAAWFETRLQMMSHIILVWAKSHNKHITVDL